MTAKAALSRSRVAAIEANFKAAVESAGGLGRIGEGLQRTQGELQPRIMTAASERRRLAEQKSVERIQAKALERKVQ